MSPVRTAPAALTASDAELRAQYLREVLDLLYPAPCRTDGGPGATVTEYLVVPDRHRPRLLVPARSRKVAAAAVRRYAEPQSRGAKLKRDAVVAALRTGASSVLLRDRIVITGPADDTIDGYLRAALGRDLAVSVHIGPARANRKPVLQLITPDGDTFAFAKLGTGPLTRDLVRAETAALRTVGEASLHEVSVPRVLHAGQWRGIEVLVQSALPVWQPRGSLTEQRLGAAMIEVAGACGWTRGRLADGAYWAGLEAQLDALAGHSEGAALGRAAAALVERAGRTELRYGAWHGDWAPWNMAPLATELLVWDWERFTTGVPAGYDAVHHELQKRIQGTEDAGAAVATTLRRAPELLTPFGVAPGARRLTALLYLVDLAARYLADRQAEAGARLGVLGTWLLPVLINEVENLRVEDFS
jgi:hypothetical protein